jgi:hypothetical protein
MGAGKKGGEVKAFPSPARGEGELSVATDPYKINFDRSVFFASAPTWSRT